MRQQIQTQKAAEHAEFEERQRRSRCSLALDAVVRQMGDRYAPPRTSLANYVVRHHGQRQILERVQALAARLPDAVRNGESVVFLGSKGTGKDFLMAALLHIATGRHGFTASWTSGLQLYQDLRDCIKLNQPESSVIGKLIKVDVLAVSDPLPAGGDPSSWSMNHLLNIVDRRYAHLRPTWLTMNGLDETEAKDRLTGPLWDRLIHGGHVLPCFWPSFRHGA